jgi:hypothetical protein
MTAEGSEPADLADAAAVLRQLLAAVAEGQLEAKGPAGARTLRRIEGAVAALEAAGTSPRPVALP